MVNSLDGAPVATFLIAIAVTVAVANVLGALATRLRQPAVVGEILAGLLLGASGLGLVWPAARETVFGPSATGPMQFVAHFGLVLFTFTLGCELNVRAAPGTARSVAVVTCAAVGLPFVAGVLLALPFRHVLGGTETDTLAYAAFVGLAISITALPVLARILQDLNLKNTRIGVLSLSSAAVGDGLMWALFAVILARTAGDGLAGLPLMAALVVGLVVVTVVVVRPTLARLVDRVGGAGQRSRLLPMLVSGALAYAALTDLIGLHPVIGAFIFGVSLPRDAPAVAAVCQPIRVLCTTVLLPVFFAGVGVHVAVMSLGASGAHWLALVTVLVVAVATKFTGSFVGARVMRIGRREALRLGALMNCRGVTEVVVATVGLETGLIGRSGFTILVLMALLTTLATGPLLRAMPDGADDAIDDKDVHRRTGEPRDREPITERESDSETFIVRSADGRE